MLNEGGVGKRNRTAEERSPWLPLYCLHGDAGGCLYSQYWFDFRVLQRSFGLNNSVLRLCNTCVWNGCHSCIRKKLSLLWSTLCSQNEVCRMSGIFYVLHGELSMNSSGWNIWYKMYYLALSVLSQKSTLWLIIMLTPNTAHYSVMACTCFCAAADVTDISLSDSLSLQHDWSYSFHIHTG